MQLRSDKNKNFLTNLQPCEICVSYGEMPFSKKLRIAEQFNSLDVKFINSSCSMGIISISGKDVDWYITRTSGVPSVNLD